MDAVEKIKRSRRVRFLLVFITFILIVMMFPSGESIESEVEENSIWMQDDLIASTSFEILKDPLVYEREKREAAESVLPIFVKNRNTANSVADSLRSYSAFLKNQLDEEIFQSSTDNIYNTFLSEKAYKTFLRYRRSENILSATRQSYSFDEIVEFSDDLIKRIYRRGLLNIPLIDIEKDSISIRDGKFERIYMKSGYFDLNETSLLVESRAEQFFQNDADLAESVAEYINHFIKPNIIFNSGFTEEAKRNAIDKVPANNGLVIKDQKIVEKT